MSESINNDKCPICNGPGADKYLWCRPCISRAARGAARYFLGISRPGGTPTWLMASMDDPDLRGDAIRRVANRWQNRFKRRLKRR